NFARVKVDADRRKPAVREFHGERKPHVAKANHSDRGLSVLNAFKQPSRKSRCHFVSLVPRSQIIQGLLANPVPAPESSGMLDIRPKFLAEASEVVALEDFIL